MKLCTEQVQLLTQRILNLSKRARQIHESGADALACDLEDLAAWVQEKESPDYY